MTATSWTPRTATWLARHLPIGPLGGHEVLWRGSRAELVFVDWKGELWAIAEA